MRDKCFSLKQAFTDFDNVKAHLIEVKFNFDGKQIERRRGGIGNFSNRRRQFRYGLGIFRRVVSVARFINGCFFVILFFKQKSGTGNSDKRAVFSSELAGFFAEIEIVVVIHKNFSFQRTKLKGNTHNRECYLSLELIKVLLYNFSKNIQNKI